MTDQLRIGVLGCGPISQIAHFDACRKAANVELYAMCDAAEDLLGAMAAMHEPRVTYRDYDEMLADSEVDAVLVATADAFHVPLARRAIAAGKHVFVEKPLGVDIDECEQLAAEVAASGLTLQVGNNRRFDPGVRFARDFIATEMGEVVAFKAWYRDSTSRYTMTDNLQPVLLRSSRNVRPAEDVKADRERYFLLTHGSHIVDSARFLCGEISGVRARLVKKFDAYCWFVDTEFAGGQLGHLELTIPVRGDMEEGFHIWGEFGSAQGRLYLPFFHKAADVECFSDRDKVYRRPLGADAYSYKLQLQAFADTVVEGETQVGADAEDGTAALRVLAAIWTSVRREGDLVRPDEMHGRF
jgi:predicted dehydrogenase